MTKPHQPDPPEPYYDSQPSPAAPSVPQSIEAEEAVIGSILINPEVFYEVLGVLAPKDFYIHRLRWIFEAVNALIVENGFQTVDILTVADRLEREGQLAEIGGPSYLTALCTQVPTSLNVLSYAKIVEEHSIRRHMIEQANALANLAYDTSMSIDKVTTDADAVLQTRPTPSRTTVQSARDAGESLKRDLEAGVVPAIRTNLPLRNQQFGGYPIKMATLINGDSSVGKSALVLMDAEGASMGTDGVNVLYCALEDPVRDLVARRVFGEQRIQRSNWRRGLTPQERQALQNETDRYIQNHPRLYFDETCFTVPHIQRSVRQTRARLLIVDDLRHVKSSSGRYGASDTSILIENFVALKDVAKAEDCALVVVHHFTKEEAKKMWPTNANKPDANYPPDLDSLSWASDLRYAIDLWLALVPDFQSDIKADKMKIIEWVMKDKAGRRLGSTEIMFDKVRQWFDDHNTAVFPYSAGGNAPVTPARAAPVRTMPLLADEPEFEQAEISDYTDI